MAHRRTFWADFKQFFWRGLGILLPTVLTLWLLVQAYGFVERQVAEPINSGIRAGILYMVPRYTKESAQPDWYRVSSDEIKSFREQVGINKSVSDAEVRDLMQSEGLLAYWNARWYLRAIGLAVAILVIYLAGLLLSGFIGRQLYEGMERLIGRVPIVKAVYPHVKQLVDLVLGEKSMAFKKVVLVQYPREGIWTVGFLASEGLSWATDASGEDTVNVYIPSTPTPFTGFTITMRKKDVLEISMTVDEAVRFVLTGGVLMPGTTTPGVGGAVADAALPPVPGAGAARGAAKGAGGRGPSALTGEHGAVKGTAKAPPTTGTMNRSGPDSPALPDQAGRVATSFSGSPPPHSSRPPGASA